MTSPPPEDRSPSESALQEPAMGTFALARATVALIAGRSGRTPGIAVEFVRFVLVGVTDVVVQFGVFNLLLWLGVRPLLATAAGVVLATANSYLLNRLWTFGHRRRGTARREFPLFAVLNLVGMGITEGVVALGSLWLRQDGYLVLNATLVVGTAVAGLFRFLAYRRWVFTAGSRPRATEEQPSDT